MNKVHKFSHFLVEFVLADTQSECNEMDIESISGINSKETCQKAVKELMVNNPEVIIEDQESVPKGCYLYVPENKIYFNENEKGLPKEDWSDDTRKVCRDLGIAFAESGGKFFEKKLSDIFLLNL